MTDYKTLTGEETEAIQALLAWTYLSLDALEMMKKYEDAKNAGGVPEETRP